MADSHKNLAYSTVATAPSPASSGTSLVVASGEGSRFPAVPFNATIWPDGELPTPANAEIVRVTAISTDTLTITRTQEGTSARTVVIGDQIAATVTALTLTDAEQSMTRLVSATAHGFAVGDVLKLTAADTYAKAQGNSVANAEVAGIVAAVPSANSFVLCIGGLVTGLSGLTAGAIHFLSPSSAGALTTTEPSTVGQISKPIILATSTTAGYLFNMRGRVITATTTSTTYESRSSNTKLVSADDGKTIDLTASITQTFDAAATLGSSWSCTIRNNTTGFQTLDPDAAETINGAASLLMYPGEVVKVISTGSALVAFYIQANPWTVVRKTADESVTGNTAVQNDDELFFTTISGALYEIEFDLIYGSPAGAGTPDLKCDFGEDATARGEMFNIGVTTADASQVTGALANQTATLTFGSAAADRLAKIQGVFWGNAGTFRLRWAQNTSNGNALIMRTGSILRYRRMI